MKQSYKNKVITICGSMKYYDRMIRFAEKLTGLGYIVLVPFKSPEEITLEEKECEIMMAQRISMSVEVWIFDYDNYIGENTKKNIEMAKFYNKEIRYYSDFNKNEFALAFMKEMIGKSTKQIMFRHDDHNNHNSVLRKPNERECSEWLKREWRYIYMNSDNISVATYRSIKGEIRRRKYFGVFNYLLNHGYGDVKDRFDKYRKSKTIVEVQIKMQLDTPIKYYQIEVDASKKEEE